MIKKNYPTLDDPANAEFLALVYEDKAELIGSVGVDSGHIEIGDCENVQIKIDTATGDGFYKVWKGKKYVLIEIDMLNQMNLDKELEEYDADCKEENS